MNNIISTLKNRNFQNKGYYLLVQPLRILSCKQKAKIRQWATDNWGKNPKLMHRIYWITTP